jgi:hypothetical protein
VLDEVDDDDESDDFTDFHDDEDALNPADEQRALMSSFEMARRDQDAQGSWPRSGKFSRRSGTCGNAPADDMDLMARVEANTLRARHR